jgi:hypothetical protein
MCRIIETNKFKGSKEMIQLNKPELIEYLRQKATEYDEVAYGESRNASGIYYGKAEAYREIANKLETECVDVPEPSEETKKFEQIKELAMMSDEETLKMAFKNQTIKVSPEETTKMLEKVKQDICKAAGVPSHLLWGDEDTEEPEYDEEDIATDIKTYLKMEPNAELTAETLKATKQKLLSVRKRSD